MLRIIGSGTLTIDLNSGELIDGASTLSLGTDQWQWIRFEGTGWKTISRLVPSNSGGLTLVERIVASNAANVEFTRIDDSHESYFAEIQAAKSASNDISMIFEFGTGGSKITRHTIGYAQAANTAKQSCGHLQFESIDVAFRSRNHRIPVSSEPIPEQHRRRR